MGKSVNEYYAEKMKKLLEMQSPERSPEKLSAPEKLSPGERIRKASERQAPPASVRSAANARPRPENAARQKENIGGREYYDKFRRDAAASEKTKAYKEPSVSIASGQEKRKNTNEPPRKEKKPSPEQTFEDKLREEEQKEESVKRALRGRKLRKIRDAVISVVLIIAVVAVLFTVVYRLMFVISDIKVEGAVIYTNEEIIAASGISEGDHLYSFRNSAAEKMIILRCPAVGSVTVDKVAPSTVNLYVTEEPITFYADFYGEYREMSENLRVLYATNREKARENGLIYLRLPTASKAYSGKTAEYSGIRNDSYIYDVTKAIRGSELRDRIKGIDLRNKYAITLNCDGRYRIDLGDSMGLGTKLKIVAGVLEDPMFTADTKATIDVSDMTAASVITDANLDMSWLY